MKFFTGGENDAKYHDEVVDRVVVVVGLSTNAFRIYLATI